MASIRVKNRKKDGSRLFVYTGNLADALASAEKELNKKIGSEEYKFLEMQRDRSVAAFDKYSKRIDDLQGFISLVRKDVESKRKSEGSDNEDE